MNVGYNPWTGWSFGMSWSNGFFNFGISWGGGYGGRYRPWGCCNGWYGGGHRGPVIINTGDINIGNTINVGNRVNVANRIGRDRLDVANTRDNVYKRPENRARVADRSAALAGLREARPVTGRANDVFADRSGNVARDVDGRWETRQDGAWRPDTGGGAAGPGPSTRPAQRPVQQPATRPAQPSTRPATQPATRPAQRPSRPTGTIDRAGLNRANAARQRGVTRQSARPGAMQRPARRR
jgi:hypothetical protein